MDNYFSTPVNSQGSIQRELNAKYQIASKELQNLYKRSTMIEPLLKILEDIYAKEDDGNAIAPLSLSINQIKLLNADIKTSLLNVKEKKSGPFQRIVKSKGENFDAYENKWDKLVKDLEVALINAEQVAKTNSEKKKEQAKTNANNNNNYPSSQDYTEQAQPTKYSLTDNYTQDYYNTTENYNNNYSYNNNAAGGAYAYQEPANYSNFPTENNNTNVVASESVNYDDNINLDTQLNSLNIDDDDSSK